jgi:hypothetical protein
LTVARSAARPDRGSGSGAVNLRLAVLAAVVVALAAVSYSAAGGRDGPSTVAAPMDRAVPTTEPVPGPSALVHPLIGASRARLDARLGPPAGVYRQGDLAFLAYVVGGDRYHVVLQEDAVVEVSRVN